MGIGRNRRWFVIGLLRTPRGHNATDLNPNYALAYINRGHAWFRLGEWDKVRSLLWEAGGRGLNFIGAFKCQYQSVAEFERRYGVCVSEDIKGTVEAKRGP